MASRSARGRAALTGTTALVGVALVAAAAQGPVRAQTWQGDVDGDYWTPGNWSGGVVPGAGGTARFDDTPATSSPAGATVVRVGDPWTVGAWVVDTSLNYSLFLDDVTFTGDGLTKSGDGFISIANDLGGTGGITMQGGALALSGTNSYTGATVISGGVVRALRPSVLGATGSGTTVTGTGAALELLVGLTYDAEPLTLNGSGVGNNGALRNVTSGNSEWRGPITLGSASRIVANRGTLTISGGIGGASDLTVGGRGDVTISSAITTGAGGVRKVGEGTLTLAGANSYAGLTSVANGTLRIGGTAGVIGGNASLTGGVLDFARTNAYDYAGTIANNGGTVRHSGAADLTLSGLISGAGAFETTGTGNLRITNAGSTISGTMDVDGGAFTNAGTIATVNVAAVGALTNTGTVTTVNNSGSATNTGTVGTANNAGGFVNTGTVSTANNAGAFNNDNLVTTLNNTAGTFTNNATITGNATISGGTVSIGAGGVAGVLGGDATLTGGTLTFDRSDAVNYAGTIANGGTVTNIGANTTTLSGTMTGGGTVVQNNAAGTLALSGDNRDFTGLVVVQNGTLDLQNGNAAGDGRMRIRTDGSVIDYADGIVALAPITINSNATQLQVLGAASGATQAGVIDETGGARPIEKIGLGTLTYTGENLYTGPTTVTAGTLRIGNGGTTGRLGQNAAGAAFGNVAVAGGAALEFNRSNTYSYGGVISGAGTVRQIGTGLLALAGGNTAANSYTGAAFVDRGTLQLSGVLGDPAGNAASLTIANGATLRGAGSATFAGSLTSNGVIALADGATDDVLTITGAYTGGGRLTTDVDLATGASDRLALAGGTGGTLVSFTQLGTSSPHPDAVVVSGAGGATFTAENALSTANTSPFSGGGGQLIAQSGLVQHWFGEASPGVYVVRADVNTSAVANVGSSISSLFSAITAFNESASAFIGGPIAPDENEISIGTWARARGGSFDVDAKSVVSGAAGFATRTFSTETTADFSAIQAGLDFGVYNINGTGWSANFGLHGGYIEGNSKSAQADLDLELPFIGFYGAARSVSGFAADFLVRYDKYMMDVNVPTAGLNGAPLEAEGLSGLVSITQRFPLTDRIYVDPSAALLFSRAEVDDLNARGADISWDAIESYTGRFGVQIGTFFQPNPGLVLAPYAAASVWHEFAGDTSSTSRITGNNATIAFPITTDRLDTHGEVSVGMVATSADPGLSGFVRGDYRFGNNIDGWAVNGGLRYQF